MMGTGHWTTPSHMLAEPVCVLWVFSPARGEKLDWCVHSFFEF